MKVRGPFLLPNRPTYYVDIGRKRKSLGTDNEAEARRMVKDITRRVLAGELDKLSGRAPEVPLHQFLSDYEKWSETAHRPATLRAEKLAFRKLLASVPRDTPVSSLTPKHFDTLASALLKKGERATSVNLHMRHLKAAFNKAREWKLCPENPASVKPLRTEKRPPAFIPPEAVPGVLMSIKDPDVRAIVTAYLATGRRRSELLALKWTDIDLENKKYFVQKSKTHLSAWYPINSAFASILCIAKGLAAQKDGKVIGKVFPRWVHSDSVSKIVKKALVNAGYAELRLHDLRHSFASLYLMNGGDMRSLMELLGHRAITTTQIYTHLTKAHLAAEVEKVQFVTSTEQPL